MNLFVVCNSLLFSEEKSLFFSTEMFVCAEYVFVQVCMFNCEV